MLQGLIDTLDQEIKDTLQSGQAAGGAYYAGRHSGLLWARHHIALIESDHQSSQVEALVEAARQVRREVILLSCYDFTPNLIHAIEHLLDPVLAPLEAIDE